MLLQQYQTDSCKTAENKRTPIQVFIQRQMYVFEIKVKGNSREIPTIGTMFGFDAIQQIIIVDWTNRRIHSYTTPLTTTTLIPQESLSDLEGIVAEWLARGIVNEIYVVDLFTQESIFETKRIELESKYQGKEIVVCGGEVFVGDNFDELANQANKKYPKRPFFSYSLKHEYSTF